MSGYSRFLLACAVFALGVLSVASPASAAAANGAIAIEAATGAYGYKIDAVDQATAESTALAECNARTNGRNDCVKGIYFSQHLCGSVAEDTSGHIATGLGNTAAEAAGQAVTKLTNGIVIATQCNSSLTLNGSSSAALFVPEPIHVRATFDNPDTSPVVVYGDSLESRSDKTYRQCVSYRNISSKTVVALKFGFTIFDDFNAKQKDFTATRDGKYTPGINIDDICWSNTLWSAAEIRQMKTERIALTSVRFDDDTVWTPGQPWTKTFSTSGTALAAPVAIQGGPNQPVAIDSNNTAQPIGPTPNGSSVSIGGATGGGGNLGATGSAFGAIAMEPSTHAVGVATDAASDDAAVYGAMSQCNAKTAGANDCKIMIKFTGAKKCAALAVDGNTFGTGNGADINNTIATALANLRANGGNIGNNILASPCNSR